MLKLMSVLKTGLKSVLAISALSAAAAAPAHAIDWEAYLGLTLEPFQPKLHYGPDPSISSFKHDMSGWDFLLGGGVYMPFNNGAYELGLDAMYLKQDYYTWGPGATLRTISFMPSGRLRLYDGNSVDIYGGVGIGGIDMEYKQPITPIPFLDGSETKLGYQLEAQARLDLNNSFLSSAFIGAKYQAAFDHAYIQNEYVEYKSISGVIGIRF